MTLSFVLDIDIPFDPDSFARINVLDFVCIMFPQRFLQVHVIVRPGARFTDNLEGQLDWKALVQRSAPPTVTAHDDSYGTVSDSLTAPSTSSMQFPEMIPRPFEDLQENWKHE